MSRALAFMLSLTFITLAGCAHHGKRPAVALQLQHSLVLSASRYTAILEGLDEGRVADTQADIDWWIDQSILELQTLEEDHPYGNWEAGQPVHSHLPMKAYYRKIAHFRRNHPRRHVIPLDADSLRQIEKFVDKYQ